MSPLFAPDETVVEHGFAAGVLLDVEPLLQRRHEVLAQMVRLKPAIGDLAQGDDRILVIVAMHRQRRAGRQHPCAVGGEEHEVKTVRHFLDAVFDGDAGHSSLLIGSDRRAVALAGGVSADSRPAAKTQPLQCKNRQPESGRTVTFGSAASICRAVRPLAGEIQPGARSQSGASTKSRTAMAGWGSVIPSSRPSLTSRP